MVVYALHSTKTWTARMRKLLKQEMRDDSNSIVFYANMPSNDYVLKTDIVECCLKVTNPTEFTKVNDPIMVPEFEFAKVECREPLVDYCDELAE
jgi:hypothetical protein